MCGILLDITEWESVMDLKKEKNVVRQLRSNVIRTNTPILTARQNPVKSESDKPEFTDIEIRLNAVERAVVSLFDQLDRVIDLLGDVVNDLTDQGSL